jgi:hypothetical protein
MIAMRRAQLRDVLHDVRGEDDDAVLADLAQQVEEAHALGRVEPRGGLVDDDELRVAEQRDGDAEALAHAARVAAEPLLRRTSHRFTCRSSASTTSRARARGR